MPPTLTKLREGRETEGDIYAAALQLPVVALPHRRVGSKVTRKDLSYLLHTGPAATTSKSTPATGPIEAPSLVRCLNI